MIELTWDTALLLYLLFALGALFGVWLFSHFSHKKKKIILSTDHIIICEYCHNTFAAKRGEKLSRCPTCHCLSSFLK